MSRIRLTENTLMKLAGSGAYQRGLAYYHDNAVTELHIAGKHIHAEVAGTYPYAVEIDLSKGFHYACSCPVGESGDCCKHVVAVALTVMDEKPDFDVAQDEQEQLKAYLATLSKDALIEMVMAQAESDAVLHNRLKLQLASQGGEPDVKLAIKQQIKQAFTVRGFIDYGRMRQFILRVSSVVDELESLLEKGFAKEVVELSQYALERGIKAYQNMDDSGGGFGDELHRLSEIFLNASRQAPPDPKKLAKGLFKIMMEEDWGLVSLADFAPILGEPGMKQLRALANKVWADIPQKTEKNNLGYSSEYYNITKLMEAIAYEDNDIDGLVAIKARNLSHPFNYLTIAQLLDEYDRYDEALDWAERGQKKFKDNMDSRLVDYLIRCYKKLKRFDDANGLAWEQFQKSPRLETYKTLQQTVEKKSQVQWCDKALQYARELRDEEKNAPRKRLSYYQRHTGLPIEILLSEKKIAEAVNEAKAHGCPEQLTARFARACEKDFPEESVVIYQRMVGEAIKLTNNNGYARAIDLIGDIQPLMKRMKKQEEFDAWLEQLKVGYKAKRNFIKFLAEWERGR